jgi:hypothetical protein
MFTELLHRKSEPEFYAFRLAIFCAMNSTIPRSPASMWLNNRQNLASRRASLPLLPHSISAPGLRFGRFSSLGGKSPS